MNIKMQVYSDRVEIPVWEDCDTDRLLSYLSVMGIEEPHNIYTRAGRRVLQWTRGDHVAKVLNPETKR